MALVISEDFKVGVGGSPGEGLVIRLSDHDIPMLEGSVLMLTFTPESAEKMYDSISELLGKKPKIAVVGAHEMPKGAPDGQ